MPHWKPESSCCVLDTGTGVQPAAATLAPTGWVFLGGARTLCLPKVTARQRALLDYSLRVFTQPGWRRWVYRVCLTPGLRRLGELPAPNRDGEAFGRLFAAHWPGWQQLPGRRPLFLAARYGSPGPYQKLSVLFVDADGEGTAFVKVALSPQASEMVLREKAWLERLAAIAELRASVPAILQAGLAGNAEAYLMTTLAPALGASGVFGEAHAHFLAALGHHTARPARFDDCLEARFLGDALPRLAPVLGVALHEEFASAWRDAAGVLKDWHGPLVLAHRDFVPWNIATHGDRLFVFDWEYAAEKASPLHDFFHFHLMPIAASRWRRVRTKRMRVLVGEGLDFVRRQYPGGSWDEVTVAAWLLVYLLDVVLFYTDSRKRFNPRRPVLAGYTDMIRKRSLWQKGRLRAAV